MSTILVTGATGVLGREVVRHLLHSHHRVRAYTHQARPSVPQGVEVCQGDIRAGTELLEATKGVDAIVHCASFFDEGNVTDVQGSRHLIRAALENGSPHLIYISIVGIDKSTFSYYRAKLEVERMIERSSLPWTIVRTTQFHDFVLKFLTSFEDKGASTITLPAGVRFQSIDTSEVAQYLANLAEQKQPAGHVPDMGGPQILTFEEIAETYKRIHNKQSVTIRSEPSKFYTNDAFPSGLNLVPDRAVGRTTWETFLLQQRA